MSLDAYLLTRQWRDTAQGIELSLWATCSEGPVNILIQGQQAVCFIERSLDIALPPGVVRKPLELSLLHGESVDALYCRQQRDLQQLRLSDVALCESDIKPVDRYLMERFIRAPVTIDGQIETRNNYLLVRQPRLGPGHHEPQLRTVAIDIETRGRTRELYSIAAAIMQPTEPVDSRHSPTTTHTQTGLPLATHTDRHAGTATHTRIATNTHRPAPSHENDVVFMIEPRVKTGGTPTQVQRSGYTLFFLPDEKTLLNAFFDWIARIDPDALTGWAVVNFDLNFMDQKCRALGIPFRLGRGGETAAVLQPSVQGSPSIARVPGRAVFDGIDLLKAGFWSFDSFSLDNVAHELLGTGKLITPEQDKVAEINRLFHHDKPRLADYNLRDCTLVNEIFIKARLLAFAIGRANLTGLALDRLGGSVAAFDNLYLPRLHRAGYVAPDVNNRSDVPGSPGGYVMDSVPGLYQNVLVLDFKSLYPSIIRTFFIDPLALAVPGDDPLPGFVGARFSRHQHILPGLIEELWTARDAAKRTGNVPMSQAIKIIMNSFYGVLGTTGCRFYSQQLASSITRRGHEIITQSRDWIEAQGYQVIYGDTDSLFVLVGDAAEAQRCGQIGTRLMTDLNSWWSTELKRRYDIDSHLEVEYETHYSRFFMPTVRGMPTGSKKRYAGLIAPDSKLVVKGLEAARTDWTPLAREFQRELFQRVFNDRPFEAYVRETAEALRRGELDDKLVYRKRLRRRLDDYARNVPPHVQAARRQAASSPGASSGIGSWIRYVITREGPQPADGPHAAPDYDHYLERQLAPAADGILQFMDTGFAAITDAQLSMF